MLMIIRAYGLKMEERNSQKR